MIGKFYAKPSAAILVILVVLAGGIYQFGRLPIALYPRTSKPEIRARLNTGAMSGLEFIELYGKDVEKTLRNISRVEKVRGNYSNGSVNYEVDFSWGVDSDQAKNDVKVALDAYQSQFPDEWGGFRVYFHGQYDSRFFVSIVPRGISQKELAEYMETQLVPVLEGIDGIAEVWSSNNQAEQIEVTLMPNLLTKYQLSYSDVKSSLKSHELDKSLGLLDLKKGGAYQIVADQKVTSIEDIKNIPVARKSDTILRLRDVAKITITEKNQDYIFKANGEKTLILGGFAKPDANIKYVAENFIATVQSRLSGFGERVEIDVLMNPASFINEAVENVIAAVILGMLIATGVVFLFLNSVRSTFIICISIPMSLLGGFIFMRLLGIELNLISLGAMALAVGMVVDGSIVVLENIMRSFESQDSSQPLNRLQLVIDAVREVRNPVIASLLTTIIVFAPLPFTSPLASAILGDLAIVMVCVLTVSVFVTLLFIPPLVILLFRENTVVARKERGIYRISDLFIGGFLYVQKWYLFVLNRLLLSGTKKLAFVSLITVLIIGGVWLLVSQVERQIMARPDTDKLMVFMEGVPESMQLLEREKLAHYVERNLFNKFKEYLSHTFSEVTDDEIMHILFLKNKKDIKKVKKLVEDHLQNSPLVHYYVDDWTPTSLRIPNPPLLKISLTSSNDEQNRNYLNAIQEVMAGFEEVGRVNLLPSIGKDDVLKVQVHEDQIARIAALSGEKIDQNQIHSAIASYLQEDELYSVKIKESEQDLSLFLKVSNQFNSPAELNNILLRVGDKILPLRTLTKTEHHRGWNHEYRQDGRNKYLAEVWTKQSYDGSKDLLKQKLQGSLLSNNKIDRHLMHFEDADAEIDENIYSLVYALLFALALICIVITLQFGSFLQTMVIMLAIPLGFIGVAFSLWAFRSTLSVNSMLGLILLCGTAVNNSIIFVDFYNNIRLIKPDMLILDALLETARLRFRPIMITTLTTILGMMPIAFGFGSGGEILQPLGIAICGGLWISTFLTVLAVPMVLVILSEGLQKFMQHPRLGKWKLKSLVSNVLIFGLLFGAGYTSDVFAQQDQQLSVETAENKALLVSPQVKTAEARLNKASQAKNIVISGWLPSLSVGRTYSEEPVKYKDGQPSGKTGRDTIKFGQNYLSLTEKIDNPFQFFNRSKISNLEISRAEMAVEIAKQNVRAQVRTVYFTAAVAKQALANAEQNLKMAEENYDSTQRRYQGGFVHSSDAKRSKLSLSIVRSSLVEKRQDYEKRLAELKAFLDVESSTDFELTTPLPEEFRYFDLPDEEVAKAINEKGSINVAIAQNELSVSDYKLKNERWDYLPDLSFTASYVRKDPEDTSRKYQEPTGPVLMLSADWTVFAGGRNYFETQSAIQERLIATHSLESAERAYQLKVTQSLSDLTSLKSQYKTQQENVRVLNEIAMSSQERFRSGLVDAKQVNDDFSDYLAGQDKLLELSLKIIEVVNNLCIELNDDLIFKSLI